MKQQGFALVLLLPLLLIAGYIALFFIGTGIAFAFKGVALILAGAAIAYAAWFMKPSPFNKKNAGVIGALGVGIALFGVFGQGLLFSTTLGAENKPWMSIKPVQTNLRPGQDFACDLTMYIPRGPGHSNQYYNDNWSSFQSGRLEVYLDSVAPENKVGDYDIALSKGWRRMSDGSHHLNLNYVRYSIPASKIAMHGSGNHALVFATRRTVQYDYLDHASHLFEKWARVSIYIQPSPQPSPSPNPSPTPGPTPPVGPALAAGLVGGGIILALIALLLASKKWIKRG